MVPYPPGGPTDVAARIIANAMSANLGQPIVIENKPGGAAGTVGGRYAASADPDGYTLVMSQVGSLTVAPFLYKLNYDPIKDFAPIGIVAETPEILTINPSLPANTIAEFVAYAKSNPGKLDFASPGVGTLPHLLGEQLQLAAGIKLTHVPYRGMTDGLMTDLMTGRLDVMFNTTGSLLQPVRSKQLRGLAVTTAQRFPDEPELPTVVESGVPGYDVSSWYGLYAPAKTPPDIIKKINADMVTMLSQPAIKEKYAPLGVLAQGSTPQELAAKNAGDVALWEPIIKEANIKVE